MEDLFLNSIEVLLYTQAKHNQSGLCKSCNSMWSPASSQRGTTVLESWFCSSAAFRSVVPHCSLLRELYFFLNSHHFLEGGSVHKESISESGFSKKKPQMFGNTSSKSDSSWVEREKLWKVSVGGLCCLCVSQHGASVQQEFSEGKETRVLAREVKFCEPWPYTESKDCITTPHQQLADLAIHLLPQPMQVLCAKAM